MPSESIFILRSGGWTGNAVYSVYTIEHGKLFGSTYDIKHATRYTLEEVIEFIVVRSKMNTIEILPEILDAVSYEDMTDLLKVMVM